MKVHSRPSSQISQIRPRPQVLKSKPTIRTDPATSLEDGDDEKGQELESNTNKHENELENTMPSITNENTDIAGSGAESRLNIRVPTIQT